MHAKCEERIARLQMELEEARAEIDRLREKAGGTVRILFALCFLFSHVFRALQRQTSTTTFTLYGRATASFSTAASRAKLQTAFTSTFAERSTKSPTAKRFVVSALALIQNNAQFSANRHTKRCKAQCRRAACILPLSIAGSRPISRTRTKMRPSRRSRSVRFFASCQFTSVCSSRRRR